jgi:hypothetical protein
MGRRRRDVRQQSIEPSFGRLEPSQARARFSVFAYSCRGFTATAPDHRPDEAHHAGVGDFDARHHLHHTARLAKSSFTCFIPPY